MLTEVTDLTFEKKVFNVFIKINTFIKIQSKSENCGEKGKKKPDYNTPLTTVINSFLQYLTFYEYRFSIPLKGKLFFHRGDRG